MANTAHNPYSLRCTAVQEERQRNKERDGDYDCNSAANEEMPVEKILEAETAVDHKTELHSASSSTGAVSVHLTGFNSQLWRRSSFGLDFSQARSATHSRDVPLCIQGAIITDGFGIH